MAGATKMKLKKIISLVCLSAALSLPSMAVKAEFLEFYSMIGKVTAISQQKIVVGDGTLRLSPTLKFKNKNNPLKRISKVDVGDFVGINTIMINKRILVDTITLLPERK